MAFVKIVLAVLLAFAVLAGLLRWWIKRWLRRRFGNYAAAAALCDARFQRPARIELQRQAADTLEPALEALWSRCQALGFRPLADFSTEDGDLAQLRAGVHSELAVAVAVTDGASGAHFSLFALDAEQRLSALGDGPGESLSRGTLDWQVEPALTPEDAWERLQAQLAGRSLRAIDLRLFALAYERAHARRMDALLARPPERAAIERAAAAIRPRPDEAQVALALELSIGQWQQQVVDAVLDTYRRASRLDAVRWERIGSRLHVVHDRLRPEDVRGMLVEDAGGEQLYTQLLAQGVSMSRLYELLAERLPAGQGRRRLWQVDAPIRATIYGPDEEAAAQPLAGTHVYEARDASGAPVGGAVVARGSREAKQQLAAMGLEDGKLLLESTPLGELPDLMLDPKLAAAAARAAREGLGMALLRALKGNAWLWLPPLLLVGWSAYEGGPYGTGDYLGFGYALLAVAALLVLILPMVLYNQLLQARMHARWRTARFCLSALTRLNLLGGITANQLLSERCKILAGEGRSADALALWQAEEAHLSPEQYQAGLVMIHDASGDHPRMIEAQRAVIAHGGQELARIDLAMALARHTDQVDEAEALIAGFDPQGLSELALAGFSYVRGLVAAARGQHDTAIRHYEQAARQARQFQSNPLVLGMIAEITGYTALALRAAGDRARADTLWQQVRPLLGLHRGCERLIARYDAS